MSVRQDSFISKLCWCFKQQLQKVGLIPKCSSIILMSNRWEKLDFVLRKLNSCLESEENLTFLTFLIKVWEETPFAVLTVKKKKIVQYNIKNSDAVSGTHWKNIIIHNSYMQHLFSKDWEYCRRSHQILPLKEFLLLPERAFVDIQDDRVSNKYIEWWAMKMRNIKLIFQVMR